MKKFLDNFEKVLIAPFVGVLASFFAVFLTTTLLKSPLLDAITAKFVYNISTFSFILFAVVCCTLMTTHTLCGWYSGRGTVC